jgi:spermidine synthase
MARNLRAISHLSFSAPSRSPFFNPICSPFSRPSRSPFSAHHTITVSEHGGTRTLYLGDDSREAETSINIEDPDDAIFEYPGLMFLGLALTPKNQNILMIGLGGGYIPKMFQNYLSDHNLTVVEVDPMVAELADSYFDFRPAKNVRLEICDGLEYVARSRNGSWDQIWLDAFNGNYIPPHLATKEFLALVKLKLIDEGLAIQNLHQTAWTMYHHQILNTTEVFGQRPVLFLGTRCANTLAMSLNSDDNDLPRDLNSLLERIKDFPPKVGPYVLEDEAKKISLRPLELEV